MRTRNWFQATAIVLYVICVLGVLSKCTRLFEGTPETGPVRKQEAVPEGPAVSERQRERDRKTQEYEREKAVRKTRLRSLEAELKSLATAEFPVALADHAREATRYRNKVAELRTLEVRAQWEREEPVKHTRKRVRELIADYYVADREAQKERLGPTVHAEIEVLLLSQRVAEFRKDALDIEAFARDVTVLIGRVPEASLLLATDLIAESVLPVNAYDPCRDALSAQCPRPTIANVAPAAAAPRPAPVPAVAETPEPKQYAWPSELEEGRRPRLRARSGERFCVRTEEARGRRLKLFHRASPYSGFDVYISPTSCRLVATGREHGSDGRGGAIWIEVEHDDGPIGWLERALVRSFRDR